MSVDSRLLMSDRDLDWECSECDSGRGVLSDASSKLSYSGVFVLAMGSQSLLAGSKIWKSSLTPSLSELCVLVGLSDFLSSSILLGSLVLVIY